MIDLIVIVGPTAAGKSSFGAELAADVGGEVVSADAFAVYRGLDVGTAKPCAAMRARVPHHLIDVADPRERYSAGMFIRDADAAIAQIHSRQRVAIVVGGTMFYVRALLQGLFPEPAKDHALREQLRAEWETNPAALNARLREIDPEAASRIAPTDRQRVLRALEVSLQAGRPMSALWRDAPQVAARYRALLLGLNVPRRDLHARIADRVKTMFAAGFVDEVRTLLESGIPRDAHALKAIGYRECLGVVDGRWDEVAALERTTSATRQLAKRQLTWLRKEAGVKWVEGEGRDRLRRVLDLLEASGGTITR